MNVVYLPGVMGSPATSPALQMVADAGHRIIVPDLPGFNGKSGFTPPTSYLDWLTVTWDAVDASGALADGPAVFVGASVGGMLAAEIAAMRPEAVKAVALLAPFGIASTDHVGFDLYAIVAAERMSHLFAKGIPDAFNPVFSELGPEEGPVARYLCEIASASLTWPLGDRGTASRLHRIRAPRLTLWGNLDELLPVALADLWGGADVIDGAGHLMEWDAPDEVGSRLVSFIGGLAD